MNQEANSAIDIPKILHFAFRMYTANFAFFATIGLMYAFSNVVDGLLSKVFQTQANSLFFFITIMISGWVSIALIYACSQAYKGAEASIKAAFAHAKGIFWLYIAVNLASIIMAVSGLLLFVIPGIYLSTIFYFTGVVVVLEKVDFTGAFRRSAQLVKPVFWRVLQFNIIMFAILILPGLVGQFIFKINQPVGNTVSAFLVAVMVPYYTLAQIGLYNKVKRNFETFDSEIA